MDSCIFCKIAAGRMNVTPVFDGPHAVAIRDINPQAPVHILVLPKKHIERLSDVPESERALLGELHAAVQAVVRSEGLREDGYRVVINEGRHGGQTVPHVHFHVLAGRGLSWPPG